MKTGGFVLWKLVFFQRSPGVNVHLYLSPRGFNLVNSRGFVLWSYIFRRSKGLNPREFTRVCVLELHFLKV